MLKIEFQKKKKRINWVLTACLTLTNEVQYQPWVKLARSIDQKRYYRVLTNSNYNRCRYVNYYHYYWQCRQSVLLYTRLYAIHDTNLRNKSKYELRHVRYIGFAHFSPIDTSAEFLLINFFRFVFRSFFFLLAVGKFHHRLGSNFAKWSSNELCGIVNLSNNCRFGTR